MSKGNFNIRFYLRTNHVNRDVTCAIMVRITVNGERTVFSTKLSAAPENWDAESNHVNGKMKADVPILDGIMAKTWGKEDELKQLKSELAALDRKIAAELAPKHDEKDGEEVKPDTQQQLASVKVVDPPGQATDDNKSMVAEPCIKYYRSSYLR